MELNKEFSLVLLLAAGEGPSPWSCLWGVAIFAKQTEKCCRVAWPLISPEVLVAEEKKIYLLESLHF